MTKFNMPTTCRAPGPLAILLLLGAFALGPVWLPAGIIPIYEAKYTSLDLELDPYYSCLDFYITPFGRTNNGAAWSESVLYRELTKRFFFPRTIALEASFYPLGWGGAMIRGQAFDVYSNLQWGTFNLVKALTLTQKEPWAFSLFIGNAIRFRPGKETEKQLTHDTPTNGALSDFYKVSGDENRAEGVAYSGAVFTTGNILLIQNRAVEAWWLEAELKIKGDVSTLFRKLQWNFELGYRHTFTTTPIIDDIIWVGAKRDRIDFANTKMELLRNTRFEVRLDKGLSDEGYWKLTALIGKSWPLVKASAARPKDRRVALTLAVGFAATWGSPYLSAGMRRVDPTEAFHWLIQPGIKF